MSYPPESNRDPRLRNKNLRRKGMPKNRGARGPAQEPPPKRRTGCVLIIAALVMLACLVAAYLLLSSNTGTGNVGQAGGQTPSTAATEADSLPAQALPTDTFPAAPTETQISLPPSDRADGQLWSPISDNVFYGGTFLQGAWFDLDQIADWEYELLPYRGYESLFLMFDQPVWLVHPGPGVERYDLTNVELELQLALPRSDGTVGLACRLQPDREEYYGLFVDTFHWELVRETGGERVVLAEGDTSAAAQAEEYAFFRLRCLGSQLLVWDDAGLLAAVQDTALSVGGAATVFDVAGGGSGQAYMLAERIRVLESDRHIGLLGETIQTGNLLTTFSGNWLVAGAMRDPDYLGQDLLTMEMRFENIGVDPIVLKPEMFVLVREGESVRALDFTPLGFESEIYPLQFPVDLPAGGVVAGELLFPGLSAEDIALGRQLLIDLRELGLGVLRFDLSVYQ